MKFDFEKVVHWGIFIAVIFILLSVIIQFIRFGSLVESGSIGPTGL